MSDKQVHILITGGGAPGAAGIIRCLKQESSFKVSAADARPNAVGKFLGDDFITIPFATDPAFTDALLNICIDKKIDVLMPLVTRELNHFAKAKEQFNTHGIKVLVSSFSSLEIANDKGRLHQFLEWRGIQVPAYRIVENFQQFEEAVNDLGYPEKTICFKPCVSNGSRGFRIISEQMNELDHLFNQKPDSTYLSLESAKRILSSGKFPELLVTEYLPGEEFSVDCLVDNGDSVLIVPRVRNRMIGGISVEGEFIKEDSIIEYCRKVNKELQLHGNIGIQVKKSSNDQFLILEINPRVQGTISSALGAGINLPVLAVKQELGMKIAPQESDVKWGTKFSRYWNEVFY